jgi:hypothetical protein
MGRYDSHKHPFQYQMNQWSSKRINDRVQREAKSIPCHVVQVEKDFITVAFENQNGIFTLPTVKIPQSMSPYGRNPTQVGDKGYAVPGNYYLGGVTGDAGGNTDFYPRGNLTTLSFEHTSHTQNPDRDKDQLTHMGGPNGWIVGPYQQQQQQQGQGQQQSTTPQGSVAGLGGAGSIGGTAAFRYEQRKLFTRLSKEAPALFDGLGGIGGITGGGGGGGLGGTGGQQQKDPTQFSFDKNGKCVVQSKDTDHVITVDQQAKKITIKVPTDHTIYVGGDGSDGAYAQLTTVKGPVINAKGRIS